MFYQISESRKAELMQALVEIPGFIPSAKDHGLMVRMDEVETIFTASIVTEQYLGFVDYQKDDGNPFKASMSHPTFSPPNELDKQIKRLIKMGIPRISNMSVEALLELPPDMYESVIEACNEKSAQSAAALGDLDLD